MCFNPSNALYSNISDSLKAYSLIRLTTSILYMDRDVLLSVISCLLSDLAYSNEVLLTASQCSHMT